MAFYAHSFDRDGEYWCVLDAKGCIVSKYSDMDYADAHRLADEMNMDALDEEARAVLNGIANRRSLEAAE